MTSRAQQLLLAGTVVAAVLFGALTAEPAPVDSGKVGAGAALDRPVRSKLDGLVVTLPVQAGWRLGTVTSGRIVAVDATDGTRVHIGLPETLWERDPEDSSAVPVPWSTPQQLLDWIDEGQRRADIDVGFPSVDQVAGRSARRVQLRSAVPADRTVGQLSDGAMLTVDASAAVLAWQLQVKDQVVVVWAQPADGADLVPARIIELLEEVRFEVAVHR